MEQSQFSVFVTQLAASARCDVADDKLRDRTPLLAADKLRDSMDGLTRRQKSMIRKKKVSRDLLIALKRARPVMPDEF